MTSPGPLPSSVSSTWLGRLGLPTVGVRDLLMLAVFCAVIAGILEATVVEVGARVLHLPAGGLIPPEAFWLAPLAAGVCLIAIAVVLIVLDRVMPRVGLLQLAFPLLITLGMFSFIRSLRQGIADIAVVVLAVGVAVALVRLVSRRPHLLQRAVPRAVPWMVAALVLYALGIPLTRRIIERRALAALPVAAEGAPNVLVIVLDAVRHHDLSLYGYERPTTPNLTAFAKKGMVFERAFTTAPWSLPGHASMLTGRYPNEMTTGHRHPLDNSQLLLTEHLTQHGYAAGGFAGNLSFLQPDYGLARGFTTYDSRPPLDVATVASTWWLSRSVLKSYRQKRGVHEIIPRRSAEHVNKALLSWIERRGHHPFFAFVNLFDAHAPYLPPAPFDTAYGRTGRYWADELPKRYSPRELLQMRAAYDGAIQYIDQQLQHVFTRLEELGELNHTIVIITADHGEEFGEHDPRVVEHSLTLYTSSTLIPFVLVYPPGVPAGVRRREPVSLRDIPATVVELAKVPGPNPFPGEPLGRYGADSLSRPAPSPRAMSVEKWFVGKLPNWTANDGELYGVVDRERHYFIDAQKQEHLFDLTTDIEERVDLATRPETAPERLRMRALVDSLLSGPTGELRTRAPATAQEFGSGKKYRGR